MGLHLAVGHPRHLRAGRVGPGGRTGAADRAHPRRRTVGRRARGGCRVNAWLLAAAVLLVGAVGPGAVVALRGPAQQRLLGASLAATAVTAVLLLLAQGFGRSSYVDVALILAVLAPTGTLVFTRLLAGDPSGAEN
ncbi:hypothetical protein C7C46_27265 [Streptomyces tateyamensis]|uniref:Uncharacterized protein n=1 Tax=Streptomyces tateyamensis TaxID=565073 RepID=A0A2V4NZE9_9ACTN|nr:hypothetical protein C7C46_27265 [Streptomyces tateyamensis]